MFNTVSHLIMQGSSPFKPPQNLWYIFAVYDDGEIYWELHPTREAARIQLKKWKANPYSTPANAGYGKIVLMYWEPNSGKYPWR